MLSPFSFRPFPNYASQPSHLLDTHIRPRHRSYPCRRSATPYEPSEFSPTDTSYHDTHISTVHRTQPSYFSARGSQGPFLASTDIHVNLHQLDIKVPLRAAGELERGKCDVLLLPPRLVRLQLQLYTMNPAAQTYAPSISHTTAQTRTLRAAVAGDLRLRDAVRQLLPSSSAREARLFAKVHGVWKEVKSTMRVSELGGRERNEIEVRVETGAGFGRVEKREGNWEREIGVERIRWSWW